MSLKQTLDDWADKLAKKATEATTPLQESTDAFKAVTAYFAAQQKRGKKADIEEEPEESGAFTFAHGSEVVNGESRQRKTVLGRRNS